MGAKRKRARSLKMDTIENSKRPRLGATEDCSGEQVHHPTLRLYYKQISTLREYLLSQLPKNSKKRRRRILTLGRNLTCEATPTKESSKAKGPAELDHPKASGDEDHKKDSLARLLDQIVICSVDKSLAPGQAYHTKDFEAFSQQINLTAGSSIAEGSSSQSELIDFAIWLLFHRSYRRSHRPSHMLCHGYQRARGPRPADDDLCAVAGIPGIVSHYPNSNVSILKGAEWNDVLNLLGKDGEKVMLDMIMRCGIFVMVGNGRGNFFQLSGIPITDLEILKPTQCITKSLQQRPKLAEECKVPDTALRSPHEPRTPASICFVRNRMFYARAALNAKGKVTFGLRHIHALNRYPGMNNSVHTLRLLQYIFPREFGLHNVFTSFVDPKETVQPFKDYTLREVEIARKEKSSRSGKIAKRLRGRAEELVQKLQELHSRCSYIETLKHYCPLQHSRPSNIQPTTEKAYEVNATNFVTQISNQTQASKASSTASQHPTPNATPSFFDLATPHADVSAFCRATVSKLIPDGFWGQGEPGRENKRIVMLNIDRFIRLRRFEQMSLHVVSQGLKARIVDRI